MMCEQLNKAALALLPVGYKVRNCRPDELDVWKAFPFDTPEEAGAYQGFMTQFFEETYGGQEDLFFEKTLFVCDTFDKPLATCASWLAYGKFQTIHWFKTLKAYEGQGLRRALLSIIMTRFESTDYPIFLHTQTGSFRAIKLYADFGFKLLQGTSFGSRNHYLDPYLPVLKKGCLPKILAI